MPNEYYNNNIEKFRQYYQEKKDIIAKREQLYYQKNKEKIREKQRTYFRNYYLLNKDKIIENSQRRYYGCILPDKLKPQKKLCNEIINNNIIIRLMD